MCYLGVQKIKQNSENLVIDSNNIDSKNLSTDWSTNQQVFIFTWWIEMM